jgi:hypothetical protein
LNDDAADGGDDETAEGEEPDVSSIDKTKLDKETKAALKASTYAKRKLINVEFRD